MAFRTMGVSLLLSSLFVVGCGTFTNIVVSPFEDGGVTPFGGVQQDKLCYAKAASGELVNVVSPKAAAVEKPYEQKPQVALMVLCAADLPFSFVGDIVTLPYTLGYNWVNEPVAYPIMKPAAPLPPQPQPVSEVPTTLPMPKPIPSEKKPTDESKSKTSP